VLIQTTFPQHELFHALRVQDYETYADALLEEKANINVYDPQVPEKIVYRDLDYLNTRTPEENRELLKVNKTPMEGIENAHAIAILTEWDEFKTYDWQAIYDKMLKPAFVFDGRRILDKEKLEKIGFKYYRIGQS